MPSIAFPNLGNADVSILWTTPGGAGGTRTATISLGTYVGLFGPNAVRVGFSVDIPDSGSGRDEALRLEAYKAVLPALAKFRRVAERDPLSIATPDDGQAVRWATIGLQIASEDRARRVFAHASIRVKPQQTYEDRVQIVARAAWLFADALIKDLQLLVEPAA